MNISRRDMIKLGLIGGGTLLLASFPRPGKSQQVFKVPPFQSLLTIPPVLKPVRSDATTDYYEIILSKAQSEIIPGTQTEIWGYNGITLAPRFDNEVASTQKNGENQ